MGLAGEQLGLSWEVLVTPGQRQSQYQDQSQLQPLVTQLQAQATTYGFLGQNPTGGLRPMLIGIVIIRWR